MQGSEKIERGGVIVFVMLISLTLILLVSLCIDVYRGLIEQSQIKHVADQTALAALEAYVNLDPATHAEKFDEAIDLAANIAGENVSLLRQVKYVDSVADLRAKTSGSVTSGRWWNYRPASCMVGTCPCGSGVGVAAPPCFQPCPDTGVCPQVTGRDSNFASAMQVMLNTTSSNPLVGMFSGVMGQRDIAVSNNSGSSTQGSVAVVAPRTHILLIDLSQRALLDSDPPFYPAPPAIVPPRFGDNVGTLDCSTAPSPGPAGMSCVYNASMPYPVWVDTSRDPFPFTTELDAANGALRNFIINALPGDKIGIIGFSDGVGTRPERIFAPVGVSDPALQTMIQLTLTKDDAVYGTVAAARAMRYARNFFPYRNQPADISGALDGTRAYLQSSSATPYIEKVITLITQGVPDCNRTGLCGAPTDTTCYPIINPISVTAADYARQQQQFRELLRGCVTDIFRNFNIRIDVALVGAGAMPHNLLLRSANRGSAGNTCMQDFEMRQRNYMNVKPNPAATDQWNWATLGARAPSFFLPYSVPAAPFLQSSLYLYSATRLTRGFWTPIRPPCPIPLSPTTTTLDQACSSGPRPPTNPTAPELAYTNVTINADLTDPVTSPARNIEDLDGRIMCDDKARTPERQMNDAFDVDFTRRSFILTN